jgi:hypothetical protein
MSLDIIIAIIVLQGILTFKYCVDACFMVLDMRGNLSMKIIVASILAIIGV